MRRTILMSTALAFATAFGCSEELTQENTDPRIIAAGPVERASEGNVFVTYSLTDREGDDAVLEALVCRGDVCQPAIQGDGGDGLARVPTIPEREGETSASHIFSWNAACGSIDASTGDFVPVDADESVSIGFRLAGSDDEPVKTADFTLSSLGFESGDGSGIIPVCRDE